ncbi:MAG: hypothetical protein ACPL7B_06930 [Candidatus Poribacteria bacterium]
MGNSVHIRNSVINIHDIARIQNVEQHRVDTQHQQTAMMLQKESVLKETRVQTSNKADSTEIQTKRKQENVGKKDRRKKHIYKKDAKNDNNEEEGQIIDFKI